MKIIKILTISFCIIMLLSCNIYALDEILSTGNSWLGIGKNYSEAGNTMDTGHLKEGSDKLYNVLLIVGTVVAVIVGAILGIQYMTAGIQEKVEVKKSLFPYIISCIVLFGSLGIWKLVVTIASQL